MRAFAKPGAIEITDAPYHGVCILRKALLPQREGKAEGARSIEGDQPEPVSSGRMGSKKQEPISRIVIVRAGRSRFHGLGDLVVDSGIGHLPAGVGPWLGAG